MAESEASCSVHSHISEILKVGKLLNLCKETIKRSIRRWSTEKSVSGQFLMNKCQCDLLVEKLPAVQRSLEIIPQFNLIDGSLTVPLLQELHHTLLEADALITDSIMTNSMFIRNDWPIAAIKQGDMGMTFSKLLYDMKWCAVRLLGTLGPKLLGTLGPKSRFENFGMYITCAEEDFDWVLSKEVGLNLLMAIIEDENSLRDHLRSVKFDNDSNEIKQGLVDQLVKQMKESPRSHLLFLKPEGLDFSRNDCLGKGASGIVQTTNFLGSLCAMKKITIPARQKEVKDSLWKELEVIKQLGHHPHLVRLFCYSQKGDEHCLIMEKMQMDLWEAVKIADSPVNAVSFSDVRDSPVNAVSFSDVRDSPVNAVSFSDVRDSPVNAVSLSDVRDSPVNAVSFSDVRDSPVNAVSLMLQIGEGVKYIHSKGVVHRDLKPENVLVNLDNRPSSKSLGRRIIAVKIADFGVSKTKEASKTYSKQTRTGTPLYMAPEVLKVGKGGNAKFNPRKADVFSFAIMCSVILTGMRPYPALDPWECMEPVREGTLRPTLPADCLPELATLIKKCWAGNPSERPLFDVICRELRCIKSSLLCERGR